MSLRFCVCIIRRYKGNGKTRTSANTYLLPVVTYPHRYGRSPVPVAGNRPVAGITQPVGKPLLFDKHLPPPHRHWSTQVWAFPSTGCGKPPSRGHHAASWQTASLWQTLTSSPSSLIHTGMGVPQYRLRETAQSRASRSQLANRFSLTNSGTLVATQNNGYQTWAVTDMWRHETYIFDHVLVSTDRKVQQITYTIL